MGPLSRKFSGDSYLDQIAQLSTGVVLLEATEDGVFGYPVLDIGADGNGPYARGDLDGDLRPELVGLQGYLKLENETFVTHPFGRSTVFDDYIETDDLNNDGLLDIVFSSLEGHRVSLGTGFGQFQDLSDVGGQAFVASPYLIDYDNDGVLDLMTVTRNAVQWRAGDGQGLFEEPVDLLNTQVFQWISPQDLNGDGLLDVLLNDFRDISFFAGRPDGDLGSAMSSPGVFFQNNLIFDFNSDGLSDVLPLYNSSHAVIAPGCGLFPPARQQSSGIGLLFVQLSSGIFSPLDLPNLTPAKNGLLDGLTRDFDGNGFRTLSQGFLSARMSRLIETDFDFDGVFELLGQGGRFLTILE